MGDSSEAQADWVGKIDDERQRRIEDLKKPQHEIGAGAECRKCGDGCQGLDLHFWRKVCKNCRCPPEDHDVKIMVDPIIRKIGKLFDTPMKQHEGFEWEYGKIKFPSNVSGIASSESSKPAEIYEWVPPGVPAEMAQKFMQMLPKEKQPIKDSAGALYRLKQMERQLPNHDMDASVCHDLSEVEKKKLNDFVDMYKKDAVGIGQLQQRPELRSMGSQATPSLVEEAKWSCYKCHGTMKPGDVAVFAERAGKNRCWHPVCFVCTTCDELLVDLIYFYKNGQIYCGRHFADTMKARCAACDELIFAREYTQAEGLNWHLKHFCCWQCDVPLGGQRYVAKDSKPYCLQCYETVLAKVCNYCGSKIAADAQRLSYGDKHWHAAQACFHCSNCLKSLVNEKFMNKLDMIFCSAECKRQKIPPSSARKSMDSSREDSRDGSDGGGGSVSTWNGERNTVV